VENNSKQKRCNAIQGAFFLKAAISSVVPIVGIAIRKNLLLSISSNL
jgi:hypothetical protein